MKLGWIAATFLATGLLFPPTSHAGVSVAIALGHRHQAPRTRAAFSNGYDNGHRDGQRKARQDLRLHRDYDLRRHRDFRNADRDARRKLGARRAYAAGYRDGFERGYRSAFSSYMRRHRGPRSRRY
ncbi:MAG: hypothetical protein JXO72_16395 [Vicinamibacteria bacterium]|nr:hypothetical protein [Vicinamibacteria bacterium]